MARRGSVMGPFWPMPRRMRCDGPSVAVAGARAGSTLTPWTTTRPGRASRAAQQRPVKSREATTDASSDSRGRWRTSSASRCGSASASTACRASCSSTCTTRSPKAASASTRSRRRASSAPTAAPSTSPRSSAPGSPTGCSARSACCSTARSSSWRVTSRSRSLPGVLGLGVGLILVAVGSGGLKANATAVVGTLYAAGRHRAATRASRSSTSASTSAPSSGRSSPGSCRRTYGFHWGFALAAVGMAIGLIQYSFGRKNLPDVVARRRQPAPPQPLRRWSSASRVARHRRRSSRSCCSASSAPTTSPASSSSSPSIAAIAYFAVIISSRHISSTDRSRVFGFIPLFIVNVGFWSLYQQQFTVLTIYSDQRLDRNILGWEMPISWVNSINPIFVIILSGVFAAIWTKLGTRAAVGAGQVRARRDHHGHRVPAVPAVRERRAQLDAADRDRRHPARLHDRRAVHLAARASRSRRSSRPSASTRRWSRSTSCRSRWAPRSPAGSPRSTTPTTRCRTSRSSASSRSSSASRCWLSVKPVLALMKGVR